MSRLFRILQISDLHFGSPFVPKVAAAVPGAIELTEPDLIVVSGDLTQRAKPEEFQAAAQWLDALPAVPKLVVPGNHDCPLYRIWERMLAPRRNYRRYISDELNPVFRNDKVVVVGLDTTNPHGAITNGRIRGEQLAMAEEIFAELPAETYRIIVGHHHFVPAPDYRRVQIMPRAQRALEHFTRQRVDLILSGHLHRSYSGNSLDVYAGEDREHGILIVQCGTTTSRRGRGGEREKNTLNVIDLYPDDIEVSHHMYFDDRGFSATSRHRYARASQSALVHGLT